MRLLLIILMLFLSSCVIKATIVPTPSSNYVYPYQLNGIYCTSKHSVLQLIEDKNNSTNLKSFFIVVINDIQYNAIYYISNKQLYTSEGKWFQVINRNTLQDNSGLNYYKCVDQSLP